jgi:hypothetical protein
MSVKSAHPPRGALRGVTKHARLATEDAHAGGAARSPATATSLSLGDAVCAAHRRQHNADDYNGAHATVDHAAVRTIGAPAVTTIVCSS